MRTREKSKIMSEKVVHPAHYQGKFETWDVLDDWFPDNPTLWNVVKYLARADRKGAPLEDLKKARVYLEREIENREQAACVGGVAIPIYRAPMVGSKCDRCGGDIVGDEAIVHCSKCGQSSFVS